MSKKYFYDGFMAAVAAIRKASKTRKTGKMSRVLFLGMMFGLFSCSILDLGTEAKITATPSTEVAVDGTIELTVKLTGNSTDERSGDTFLWEVTPGSGEVTLSTNNTETVTVTGNRTGSVSIKVTVTHGGTAYTAAIEINVTDPKVFATIISNLKKVPDDLSRYDQASREIFSTYTPGATVVAKYVSTESDGDGDSYNNAARSVKIILDRITNASASNVYVVLVARGDYNAGAEMSMKNNVAIVGGVTESLEVASMTDASLTVLNGTGKRRVFNNSGITNTAILYGVTIANGKLSGQNGAGMYNINSSPVLTRVAIINNTARYGGGIYNNEDSFPVLTQVTIVSNMAEKGGGMYNDNSSPVLTRVAIMGNKGNYEGGGMFNNNFSRPILTDVTFAGNEVRADSGGGMYNNNSFPVLTRVAIVSNIAKYGGGMYNWESSPALTRSTFTKNRAGAGGGGMRNYKSSPVLTQVAIVSNSANYGGGMYNDKSSPVLTRVAIMGNTASYGGGMYNEKGGTYNENKSFPTLTNVTISGNTAADGGGMYIKNSSPKLYHVTIYGNEATNNGGGMYLIEDSSPTLINVTLAENTGGGIHIYNGSPSPTLINTILWGNSIAQIQVSNSGSGVDIYLISSLLKGGLPNDYTGGTAIKSGNTEGGIVVSGSGSGAKVYFNETNSDDPHLGNLADHGGNIKTVSIQEGGAAYNGGVHVKMKKGNGNNDTYYYSEDEVIWYKVSKAREEVQAASLNNAIDLTTTDATGRNRSGRPDIGAYEAR